MGLHTGVQAILEANSGGMEPGPQSPKVELAVVVIQGTSPSAAQVGRASGPGPERSGSHLSTTCSETLTNH